MRLVEKENPMTKVFRISLLLLLLILPPAFCHAANDPAVDRPPAIDPIGNRTIGVDIPLQFTINGSDPDGDKLTYSASYMPQGASLDPDTGVFRWKPTYEQIGTYTIVFTASDGKLSDSKTAIFKVTVALPGDANMDGMVNGADLNIVLSNYNMAGDWSKGDFNGDGIVNGADLNIVLSRYNQCYADNVPQITANLFKWINGPAPGGMLGSSVISRDVNGDGFNDIIISAPGNSAGTDVGKVYIYFGNGSDNIGTVADLTLTGNSAGGCFGYSMAVGDISGDGYDDLVIGEPFNDENGVNSGKVYVYFGGPSLRDSPDITINGQAAGDLFGYLLICCDLNNDGRDDIIVGTPYNSSSGGNAGKVYIYYGGQTLNTAPDLTLKGEYPYDLFGMSLASAKNIDGNGHNAIIIGASGKPGNTDRPGKVYVYTGGATMNTIPAMVMTGETNGDLFGISVSAGDFNGDGCDDIIVGAENNNSSAMQAGKAYIYFGGKNMTNVPSLTFTGESANDHFGHLVASAGDLNGDGFSDIFIDSPNNTNNAGKAYIYFGGLFMDNTAKLTIKGKASCDNFGSFAVAAGDIDKDGVDELIIGSPGRGLTYTR